MESTADGGDNQSSTSVVEARDFIKFIVRVVPAILEGETGESNSHELRNACNSAEYFECIKKFLSDSQIRALIVSKSVLKDEEEDSSGTDSATESERDGRVTYSIHLNVQYTAPKLISVGFIKRSGVVEADKKIASQLRVLNLSDDSPFETLHSFVSNAIAPYFKSFVKTSGKADRTNECFNNNIQVFLL
ncbi:cytoplasmic dynein 1 heavy chain 1-like [Paramuricea clavata]|uniref:Cytoplasmic dynein 1 heavy chain 1-like n=1 Tax=Paramuricea clavata TaxID=317549 RepID=A0A7D9JSN5_PARCT|nr:cytoplasmic dynein 1 heavy chain 1-like [Paramuricea clavata]